MKLRWTRRAVNDLRRIGRHIAKDKPMAATAFVAAVQERVDNLSLFPFMGRVGALPDTRDLVVHKNYLVTYRVEAGEVQVLQVWHVARKR
jgi:toxin ParE1/3/4